MNTWEKPQTPGTDVTFYSKKSGNYIAKVITLDGITVSTTEVKADKGFNILSYDMAFSKAGKMAYLKKNKTELRTANNGKTYLPLGTYIMEIAGNGTMEKQEFRIEAP